MMLIKLMLLPTLVPNEMADAAPEETGGGRSSGGFGEGLR